MAFGKAVAAEAFDLVPAIGGEGWIVAARSHAIDELVTEFADGANALEGRHSTTQAVGLARPEAGGDDGDAHGVFLEQRHAERLLQHPAQFALVAVLRRRPWKLRLDTL